MAFELSAKFTLTRERCRRTLVIKECDTVNVDEKRFFQLKPYLPPWTSFFTSGTALDYDELVAEIPNASSVGLPGIQALINMRNEEQVDHLLQSYHYLRWINSVPNHDYNIKS